MSFRERLPGELDLNGGGDELPPIDDDPDDGGGGTPFCWTCEEPLPMERHHLRLCETCAKDGLCATCAGSGTVGCVVTINGSMGLGQRTCSACGGEGSAPG